MNKKNKEGLSNKEIYHNGTYYKWSLKLGNDHNEVTIFKDDIPVGTVNYESYYSIYPKTIKNLLEEWSNSGKLKITK